MENVKENMEAGTGVKATASDSLRAAEMLLKLMGAFPSQKRTQTTISMALEYWSMSKEKLIAEQKRLRKFYSRVLDS